MISKELSISIVISSFNYADFLDESIKSALSQTLAAVQVIVVDDGSTDGSIDIIRSHGADISAIVQPPGGQASAWNAGVRIAVGDYVIFLDSDDRLLPHAAAAVAEAVGEMRPSKVHWPMQLIDADGRDMGITLPGDRLPSGSRLQAVVDYGIDPGPNMPSSGNAWHRRYLDAVMPIPEAEFRIAPDTYLHGLSPLFGETVALAEVCSHYRSHDRNNGALGTVAQLAADVIFRSDLTFSAVVAELALRGVVADPARWRNQNPNYRHYREIAVGTD